jgi:DNA-binding CsgD family transcriptional regulator
MAAQAGLEARVATVYGNWGATACDLYQLDDAVKYLAKGIAYSGERDLDLIRLHLLAWQAYTLLLLGRWPEAVKVVNEVIVRTDITSTNRIPALVVLGRLHARSGDSDPLVALDEALRLALRTNAFQDIGQVRAARAEAAWLSGDTESTLREARAGYDLAVRKKHPWIAGELAYWRWRAGDKVEIQSWMARPFALQITGDWQAAARAWHARSCPYEEARALADGDAGAQMAALGAYETLGARADINQIRRKLATSGVQHIPRGPHPATRQNPFNLTNRQVEILVLLIENLTNAEIATRLHIAPKTVDHHISAVLAKLDVHTRDEAAQLARQLPSVYNKK